MKSNGLWLAFLIFLMILMSVNLAPRAWAQSEQALYAFKGGPNDGANPFGRRFSTKPATFMARLWPAAQLTGLAACTS